MPTRSDPVRPADAEARALAHDLLARARHAALAFTEVETGAPGIGRIAFGLDASGAPVTLISSLAPHFAALQAHPRAALMVGDPGPKGDPLTHPRLMIAVDAGFVGRTDPEHAALRTRWLADHPKSTLYIDFADFAFVRFRPLSARLNGGFGKAFRLAPEDLVIA